MDSLKKLFGGGQPADTSVQEPAAPAEQPSQETPSEPASEGTEEPTPPAM